MDKNIEQLVKKEAEASYPDMHRRTQLPDIYNDMDVNAKCQEAFISGAEYLSSLMGGMKEGWVSVEERLPEVEQQVLVSGQDVGITNGRLINKEERIFDSADWFSPSRKVTHWMPLPPSPEK